jgi:hypothetical protein
MLGAKTTIKVIILGQLIASRWIEQSQVGITSAGSRGESRCHTVSSEGTSSVVDSSNIIVVGATEAGDGITYGN